jgi:RNA polymerase sigma-70 factor (ECF subfamily)
MWPDLPVVEELLERARRGDADAVDRLLAMHREPLRRLIGHRLDAVLARRVDASDIVQDVLLEASRRLSDYLRNPAMPFPLWLRHLARDHVIDAHRRHRLAQRRSLDREQPIRRAAPDDSSAPDAANVFVDAQLTPATAALRHEMVQQFEAALARLGPEDQEVIVLRHVEQLSNGAVAAQLKLSEPAASMRYLRALRRLQALLSSS